MIVALALNLVLAPTTWTLDVGGTERKAIVHAPNDPKAILFGFHGHGGGMRQAERSFKLHAAWPEAVVIYPEGLPTSTPRDEAGAKRGWEMRAVPEQNKDIAFFDSLVSKAKADLGDVPVFVMGHSNGGGFVYSLWRARGDAIAGFAPSAAAGAVSRPNVPNRPFFVIGGTKDSIVEWSRQEQAIETLKARIEAKEVSAEGDLTLYEGKGGVRLGTYITDGSHAFQRNAVPHMVEFFRAQL